MKRKTIFAGIIGEILEWYDFTLYGFFAPILATLFFPSGNKTLSLLATFGGFATGYFMRPLGGIIFGHFGDKIGRKNEIVFSILIAISMVAAAKIMITIIPANLRYSCVAFGHGICDSIFSGTAPFVATFLVVQFGTAAPAYYIAAAALITLIVAVGLKAKDKRQYPQINLSVSYR